MVESLSASANRESRHTRSRALPYRIAGLAAIPGAVLILGGVLLPQRFSAVPDLCILHRTTGLWCPLCGGTRATAALIRGDLEAAMAYNPFAVATELVAVLLVLRWVVRRRAGRDGALMSGAEMTGYALAAVLFLIVRNLPGMWIHLGPLLGPPG
ncbi:DUF2752 domain-containing protein [Actinomyces slackii]|uniref:Protein of uncharacterized function (DUF2752) n=1 Tax=Actinomyces slackii TaxID=52774 RepID=A0A3S4SFZ5_9ACTO|nr:Protein of uncharacterised function (DUF2752) [Actinomyces slackii]